MTPVTAEATVAALPIRRNTLLLGAAMAVFSAVLQLVAAVSSLTFVLVTGVKGLLGLGPAIFLVASALAAVPAGRAMDRFGRRPVVALGFGSAAAGCSLTALAANLGSAPLLILGFALTGGASGVALLIRTAAGDMYPPERRASGISYVLFGSVFGALLGPALFGPLFAGRELEADALTLPWLAAGALALVALGLVACAPKGTLDNSRVEMVRVDGRRYEVRIASTEVEGEYRLLIVRATIVINPDPQLEAERNWNVVQPFMQRTCKGPFVVLENHLADDVNLYIRFRCGA